MYYKDIDFFPGVNLIISNNCRMNCSFCCSSDLNRKEKIDKETIFKIIDILHKEGTKRICYTGGEPILIPFFKELIKYSSKLGIINTVMSSDGELIDKLDIEGKYFDTFWLSIHGLYEDHDSITNVKGSFEKLKKTLKNKNGKLPLSIWTVVTPDKIDKLDKFINWCIESKVEKIYLSNVNKTGKGERYSNEKGRVSDKEFSKLVEYYQDKYRNTIKIFGQKFDRDCQCTLVYPNGDIYLTPFEGEKNNQKLLGNLLSENPKEIFNRIKSNKKVWEDYISRYKNSSLFKKNK